MANQEHSFPAHPTKKKKKKIETANATNNSLFYKTAEVAGSF